MSMRVGGGGGQPSQMATYLAGLIIDVCSLAKVTREDTAETLRRDRGLIANHRIYPPER